MESTALGDQPRSSKFEVLVDSDAFVGWVYPDDKHFHRASEIFEKFKKQGLSLVTTSFVVSETATVLSYKVGQALAKFFLEEVIKKGSFPVIHITEDLQEKAIETFSQQTQRGTSVVDCANVAVMRKFQIPTIFSFDQIYAKKFGVKMATI
jgi:predicted nucleic acid-binding protein